MGCALTTCQLSFLFFFCFFFSGCGEMIKPSSFKLNSYHLLPTLVDVILQRPRREIHTLDTSTYRRYIHNTEFLLQVASFL